MQSNIKTAAHTEIQGFLKRFHSANDVDTVFTQGCCYWFAMILFVRFIRENAEIMYDSANNHFGTRIHGRVYDVTGDVTDTYSDWMPWNEFDAETERQRIMRDCVMF